MKQPCWTVHYNILSQECCEWIGTGWEFFNSEIQAEVCFQRHVKNGNCPTKRPFHKIDKQHMGACHRMEN